MSATIGIAPVRSGRPPGRFGRSASRLGRSVGQRFGGIMAIGVKELRGRMRGRRAFVVLTVYLTLIAGVAWMIESIAERSLANSFGGSTNASAQIGQGIFAALLVLEMVIVIVLAPSFTAGAVSLEREKQTIDLLITTPISSLSIVLGKLFSALVYLFLVIVASVPLTALVFVYGGAGPEDLVKGYVVLLVTAFGLGSVGVFCSSLARRTQPATVITYALVLLVTFGTGLVWVFWGSLGNQSSIIVQGPVVTGPDGNVVQGPAATRPRYPPEALLWLNPFVSIADVFCGTETGFGGTCSIIATVTGRDPNVIANGGGVNVGGGVVTGPAPAQIVKGGGVLAPGPVPIAVAPDAAFGVVHDTFWPHAALAWLVVSFVLIVASVQMVSPTRRWRPGWPFRRRRATAATAATTVGGPATHPTIGPATDPGIGRDPTAAPDPETTPDVRPGPEGAKEASS
jgi:ABC-type transport system involved in multi-copper enzyme maturation permease subunit